MPISPADKEDVISSVLIETERLFEVLTIRYPLVKLREQSLLLQKIEDAYKKSLVFIELSPDGVSTES